MWKLLPQIKSFKPFSNSWNCSVCRQNGEHWGNTNSRTEAIQFCYSFSEKQMGKPGLKKLILHSALSFSSSFHLSFSISLRKESIYFPFVFGQLKNKKWRWFVQSCKLVSKLAEFITLKSKFPFSKFTSTSRSVALIFLSHHIHCSIKYTKIGWLFYEKKNHKNLWEGKCQRIC